MADNNMEIADRIIAVREKYRNIIPDVDRYILDAIEKAMQGVEIDEEMSDLYKEATQIGIDLRKKW